MSGLQDINSIFPILNVAYHKNINLDDKTNVYVTSRLDFKDEMINKFTVHSQYLFSDCALTSRNYLLTFSDRFLTKLSMPENDLKKNVSFFYEKNSNKDIPNLKA